MKKAKAIELLKLAVPIKALTQQEYSDFIEAINMAIDALEQPTSPDTISRQATIDAVNNAFDRETLLTGFVRSIAVRAIRDMPSAQPEPHEGHWIKHIDPSDGEQYECSECGVLWEFNDGSPEDNEAYFCPKCGKKLITK